MVEGILNEGAQLLQSPFVTKIFFGGMLYVLMRISRRLKYIGYYMIAQDYAIKNTLLNGKSSEYDKHRMTKLKDLMEKNNFERKIKE